MTRRIIFDTDIGTDVDDALALAFALRHPDIEVVVVTTVAGDTHVRAQIAARILQLAGEPNIEVAAGVQEPIGGQGRMAWFGHEGQGILEGQQPAISQRDAVDVIIETLLAQDTEVVTLGPLSNLAAALDREPRIAERIPHLTVMGGFFHRCVLGDQVVSPNVDYNLNADQQASVRALSAPIPTTYVPGDVTMRTALRDDHVRCLEESDDALNQTLARLIRIWTPFQTHAFQAAGLALPAGLATIPHDPLAVATLVDRSFVEVKDLPSTVAVVDGFVRTFIDPAAGRDVEVVTDVDTPAFAEFFLETLGVA